MARIVNVHEAKTHLTRILEEVRSGSEVILAKNGVPYAKLVPLATGNRMRLGFASGRVTAAFFGPLSDAELREWE